MKARLPRIVPIFSVIAVCVAWAACQARGEVIHANYFGSEAESADWTFDTGQQEWESSGGNPGGYLHSNYDGAGITFAHSNIPNLNTAYGCTLSWDFMIEYDMEHGGYFSYFDVMISIPSTGDFLYGCWGYDANHPIEHVWQHYSIPLVEGYWFRSIDDQPASAGLIMTALGEGGLAIRTEVIGGWDSGALDNIVFSTVPEPASMFTLVIGSLVLVRRRFASAA